MSENSLRKFQDLLRMLFQFDCADLDFGIYRILNYKRSQVEAFICECLPQIVDEAFAQYAAADKPAVEQELEQTRQEILKNLGEQAIDESGQRAQRR
jgi:adenine-specific DNA-methyltransferase